MQISAGLNAFIDEAMNEIEKESNYSCILILADLKTNNQIITYDLSIVPPEICSILANLIGSICDHSKVTIIPTQNNN